MNTIIIFAAALFSCKNDFDLPLYPTYEWPKPLCDTTLKVVWQKIIAPDSIYGMAQFFAINGKNIYWVGSDHGNVESNTDAKLGYFEFDGKEIKESWTLYKDRSNDTKNLIFRNKRKFIVYEGKLIFTAWSDLFCFSENGELLWKNSNFAGENEHGSGGPFISGYGNKVYFPSDGNKITDESYLFEIDIETGKERLLFTEPMKDNLTSHLECPVIYTQNTDTIAAFQSRKWNIETQARRADMVAWNLSKNELLWRVDSLDRYAQSSSNPILFENNKLYYAGAFDIYCLDPFTGKLIWRQSFDDYHYQFTQSSLLLLNHGLVIKSDFSEIALLDKETGAIIWENRGVGTNSYQIEHYKGDLIMTSGGKGTIECLDSRTGLLKWKAKAPNNCKDSRASFGLYSFVINPETNLLYICDNFFVQCLKLPGYD